MKYIYYNTKAETYIVVEAKSEDGAEVQLSDYCPEDEELGDFQSETYFVGTEDQIRVILLPMLNNPQHEEESE